MTPLLRALIASRPTPSRRGRCRPARFVTLALEELERRELPSGSGWNAMPDSEVTPLGGTGASTVYTPAQIRQAYGFNNLPFNGAGQTIAIVDAYDDPNVYPDLIAFDRTFGLADPPAFIKATPGGTPMPNANWAGEIALDVEWAHVLAPAASILLVEARTGSTADLLTAVDYARNYPRVSVVSMSWGGPEFFNEAAYDSHFTTPAGHVGGLSRLGGITFVASSGDSGAWSGPEWPAVSPDVLAVGGTTLNTTANGTYASETGWSDSGGGYSKYDAEPFYQNAVQHTARRSDPDVAYNADTATGVFVYDTYAIPSGYTGWYSYGGTSAGAPQWAALIALADQGRNADGLGTIANAQATVYSLPASDFHTIVGGNNGYAVTSGYNPATGRGSPYADRVVWGLISAGSATLTVGPVSGSAQLGAVKITAVGGADGASNQQLATFALSLGETDRQVTPPTDAVFVRHDENVAPRSPAITRLEEALHKLAWDMWGVAETVATAGQDGLEVLLGEPAA